MKTEKKYEIKKKYCPAFRQNVIFKVYEDGSVKESCINEELCRRNEGCKNAYITDISSGL